MIAVVLVIVVVGFLGFIIYVTPDAAIRQRTRSSAQADIRLAKIQADARAHLWKAETDRTLSRLEREARAKMRHYDR